jgi:predicted component of type VI protein secretion system
LGRPESYGGNSASAAITELTRLTRIKNAPDFPEGPREREAAQINQRNIGRAQASFFALMCATSPLPVALSEHHFQRNKQKL